MAREYITGKNNRFPFLDILGYLKNTHKNPKFGRVRQIPIREFPTEFPNWDLSHFQIWDFFGYSLNTLKYPKLGIRYFFLCIEFHASKNNLFDHWEQQQSMIYLICKVKIIIIFYSICWVHKEFLSPVEIALLCFLVLDLRAFYVWPI